MDELGPVARRHLRRNFRLGVLNGTAYGMAEAMIDSSLVMSWFISQLTSSSLLVGLVSPIRNAGWFLPQLFISGYAQRQERKMPLYHWCSVVRSVSLGLLAAAVWGLGARYPGALLACLFVFITLLSLGEGFSGISFLDIVAKTIPARRRGSFFAWRSFLGGLLALGSGAAVRYILGGALGLAFPDNFALLFTLAFVGMTISVIGFSSIVEPIEPVDGRVVPFFAQLRRAWGLARQDRNLSRLIIARMLLVVAGGIATPFYIVYAKDHLGAPASSVGTYLLTLTVFSVAANFVWSRISARFGNKMVIVLSAAAGMGAPLGALSAGLAGSLPLFFLPFALQGVYQSSIMIGQVNFILDIAPGADRPIYIGLVNTILGITSMALAASGLIVDWVGYHALFGLAALFFALGCGVALGLRDPRAKPAASPAVTP